MQMPRHTRPHRSLMLLCLGLACLTIGCPDDPLPSADMQPSLDMSVDTQDMPSTSEKDQGAQQDMPSTRPDMMQQVMPDLAMPPEDMTLAEDMTQAMDQGGVDMPRDMNAPPDMMQALPPLTTDVRNYIFGHSLILHSETANVPRWLQALADHAGYNYGMSGQYGFADTHAANLPPFAQWGVSGVTSIWDDDSGLGFGDVDVNTVLFTEANFRQYYPADEVDPDGFLSESTVQSTSTVFDWVEQAEPGVRFVIYENWPDMGGYTSADFVATYPSSTELQSYYSYTRGDFHTWWVGYIDAMRQARPGQRIDLIPVGSIMVKLLEGTLSDVPAEALYEDNAPHGRPTLYFIAGLITYMGIYGEKAPSGFIPPEDLHGAVQQRYNMIVDEIWLELQHFNNQDGAHRVWGEAR